MTANSPDNHGSASLPQAPDSSAGWRGALGGLLLLALSSVFIVGGWKLGLGVPTRLGTGAFPFVSGVLLAILAVCIAVTEYRGKHQVESPDWIALLAISAALAVFAATIDRLGLLPAVVLTIVIASIPDRSLSFPGKLVLGGVVALACWGLFITLLQLPFKPWVGF